VITLDHERLIWSTNALGIGVDEAGRGALAGPVAAAAVVFAVDDVPAGLNDSKRLTPAERVRLAATIRDRALAHAVAFVTVERIDEINILQATFEAMHTAIDACAAQLGASHDLHCLIDGNRFRAHRLPHTTIVGGDAVCASIAAASILAKTSRDAWMIEAHERYPAYGFDHHKGYGTPSHRAAIRAHGPCDLHRTLFIRSTVGSADPAMKV
jgi:ribonuclease HII